MGGFLYYLPGRSAGISLAEVQAAGLAYAIDAPISTVGVRGGPDGGDGVLLALSAAVPPEQLRYDPAAQQWRKSPQGDLYVGVSKDQSLIPNPQSLARPKQLAGSEVLLADGRAWLVPIARGWIEEDGELRWYHALPQRSVLGDDGTWRAGEVLPRFAALWDLAMRFEESRRQALFGIEDATDGKPLQVALDFDGLHEAAIQALQQNYRLGPAEADLLGLLTGEIAREILEALIDLPTRVAWFKKKQSAAADGGSNTAAGSPAGTPATVPPAPTSGR